MNHMLTNMYIDLLYYSKYLYSINCLHLQKVLICDYWAFKILSGTNWYKYYSALGEREKNVIDRIYQIYEIQAGI